VQLLNRETTTMNPPDPRPIRPRLTNEVHAALIKAGRPVTRGELSAMFLSNTPRVADIQAALDALAAEGLAVKSEERVRWRRFEVWQAIGEERR
jgi:hypothetical protein